MSSVKAREALNAAREARAAAINRVVEEVVRQFDFIICLREKQYEEALQNERSKNSKPSIGVDG